MESFFYDAENIFVCVCVCVYVCECVCVCDFNLDFVSFFYSYYSCILSFHSVQCPGLPEWFAPGFCYREVQSEPRSTAQLA